MIDVKKLITGFLILAFAGGAAALIITNVGASASTTNSTAIVSPGAATDPSADAAAPLTGNAFLPTPAAQTVSDVVLTPDSSTTDAIASDPNNLTNILANAYVNALTSANPSGPQDDGTGNKTLVPPDSNTIISQFLSSSTAVSKMSIPDWDFEASQIPVVIVSSTPTALANYGSALSGILTQDVNQANLQGMLSGTLDPSQTGYIETQVQNALQDIGGLKTPAAAANFQKSLVKTLVYAKNYLALGENASADPLKTELIVQGEDAKYQAAIQALQTQTQDMQTQKLFSMGTQAGENGGGNGILASIQSLLGIQTAHAQWFVADPVADAGILAQVANMVEREIQDVVLQLLKNTIVLLMQKTIIQAIQGNKGVPGFIQNWALTAANAFQQTALNALNSQMLCVGAAPFATQLRLNLGAFVKPNTNACAVQFNNQLNNNLTGPRNFYTNFSNGGWLAFGQTMQPGNNYYGSLFYSAQAVNQSAQNGQTAAQTKSIANQGFHGNAVCDDGSSPTGNSTVCFDDLLGYTYYVPEGQACPPETINDGTEPNDGECSDGSEPEVQTPGTIASNMINSSINGDFSLVTSANSWAGLASGLFVSIMQEVLNSLAKTTITDVNGILTQAIQNGGSSGVTQNTVGTVTTYTNQAPVTPVSFQCLVTEDSPYTITFGVVGGGTVTLNGGVSTPNYNWTVNATGPTAVATALTGNGTSFTTTFLVDGTYTVTLTDSNPADANPDGSMPFTTCTAQIPWAPPGPNH